MPTKLTSLLIVVATILAAVAIGCGSDDPNRTVTVAPRIGLPLRVDSVTRADYVARANRICRISAADMRKSLTSYRREKGSSLSEQQLFAYAARNNFLPHMQFWFDDISYLGAPKGDKSELETMLEVLQLAVHSGEERRILSATELSAVFSSFTRLARQYGLDDCLVSTRTFEPAG